MLVYSIHLYGREFNFVTLLCVIVIDDGIIKMCIEIK